MRRSPNYGQLQRVIALALLLALLGGAAGAQQTSDSNSKQKPVAVMDSDNGKTIELTTGQTLQVKLALNSGTGYQWSLSGDPAPLKLTKSYVQHTAATARRMGGGMQLSVFDLSANGPGVSNVTFVFRRSWEYNVAPAKTFTVRVNVR